MAELADALDSGSSESNFMQVQVLFPAPPRDSDIDTISGSFLLHFFRGCDAELKEMPAIIGDWKGINAGFRFYQSNIQFASRRTADRIGH